MGTVGVIVNPYSGKDVRRIESSATTVDNMDKANIIERIAHAMCMKKQHRMIFMPDDFGLSQSIVARLKELGMNAEIFEMFCHGNEIDTTVFADKMCEIGSDLLIVLGGDGTNRAVAKACGEVPLLSVSTGTNNVFPDFCEGTVAGLAAAALADHYIRREDCGEICKRIEVYKNGTLIDIGLIDAVISSHKTLGEKAICDVAEVETILTAQCHPAAIGLSTLAGVIQIVLPQDDFGVIVDIDPQKKQYLAAITAGVIQPFGIVSCKQVALGETIEFEITTRCIVALDGEPKQRFVPGDKLGFKILRNGPRKVNIKRTISEARRNAMFEIH